MPLYQWSTTPASNASAGAIDWAEGQPPSTVNDSARQMMADVATWFAGPEWLNYGLTPTYVSGTQFTVAGNQTATYSVGRRVRAFVTAGTVYGTITASAYASLTTVTVSIDSGSLDSGLSEIDVGILNPAYASLAQLPSFAITGTGGLTFSNQSSPNVAPIKFGDGSGWKLNFQTTAGTTVATLQDNGNFSAANVTITSDERIKGEWDDLPSDFLDRLCAVKHGTYRRIDIESDARHVGVTAQSLREVLPEAVLEGNAGMLSVAYGNAALVACIELAREIARLREIVEAK
jgi:hypothetical protein